MKQNRYIKAMEIGLAHEKEGISYFDLIDELQKQLKFKFGTESELTFLIWFSENFRKSNKNLESNDINDYSLYQKRLKGIRIYEHQIGIAKLIEKKLGYRYWLNGDAVKQYLDYLELVESRQTAQDAREASNEANEKAGKSIRLAVWAIVVSALVGLISIVIDLMAAQPPYDVKVIENNTSKQQLEMENDNLREELYKAEMMLEAYESESDSVSGS